MLHTKFLSIVLLFALCFTTVPLPPLAAEPTVEIDESFLDLVQEYTFRFFRDEMDPNTGLVKDRANNFYPDNYNIASVASVGFALTAYPIGVERGWMTREEAYERTLRTLKFFDKKMEHEHGFYYHFVHMHDGRRATRSELSSIDTALFIAGALFAGEYFAGTEVQKLAQKLYERIDFQWMLADGNFLRMGWTPEGGFLKAKWSEYNEGILLYILAIGSPTHPIPVETWAKMKRPIRRYTYFTVIASPPLFTHQYPHFWIDFRGVRDGFANYFDNSRYATLANRQFCVDLKEQYVTYSEHVWGLTACDGPNGYQAYGAEPGPARHDGTVAPTAAGGSMMFTPEFSYLALKTMHHHFQDRLWGRYGFSDSFNLDERWYAKDVIGIDQGAILLSIENYRSGLIWRYTSRYPAIQQAMQKIGFQPGTVRLSEPMPPYFAVPKRGGDIQIDGALGEWEQVPVLFLTQDRFLEFGDSSGKDDVTGQLRFQWDAEHLYVALAVQDDDVLSRKDRKQLYLDDCLELFIDPRGDGLEWGNAQDVQLGFSPDPKQNSGTKTWAWFQKVDPQETKGVQVVSQVTPKGYHIEAAIRWSFIGFQPASGKELRLSPAIHDIDRDHTEAKYNWYFYPRESAEGVNVGILRLE